MHQARISRGVTREIERREEKSINECLEAGTELDATDSQEAGNKRSQETE